MKYISVVKLDNYYGTIQLGIFHPLFKSENSYEITKKNGTKKIVCDVSLRLWFKWFHDYLKSRGCDVFIKGSQIIRKVPDDFFA